MTRPVILKNTTDQLTAAEFNALVDRHTFTRIANDGSAGESLYIEEQNHAKATQGTGLDGFMIQLPPCTDITVGNADDQYAFSFTVNIYPADNTQPAAHFFSLRIAGTRLTNLTWGTVTWGLVYGKNLTDSAFGVSANNIGQIFINNNNSGDIWAGLGASLSDVVICSIDAPNNPAFEPDAALRTVFENPAKFGIAATSTSGPQSTVFSDITPLITPDAINFIRYPGTGDGETLWVNPAGYGAVEGSGSSDEGYSISFPTNADIKLDGTSVSAYSFSTIIEIIPTNNNGHSFSIYVQGKFTDDTTLEEASYTIISGKAPANLYVQMQSFAGNRHNLIINSPVSGGFNFTACKVVSMSLASFHNFNQFKADVDLNPLYGSVDMKANVFGSTAILGPLIKEVWPDSESTVLDGLSSFSHEFEDPGVYEVNIKFNDTGAAHPVTIFSSSNGSDSLNVLHHTAATKATLDAETTFALDGVNANLAGASLIAGVDSNQVSLTMRIVVMDDGTVWRWSGDYLSQSDAKSESGHIASNSALATSTPYIKFDFSTSITDIHAIINIRRAM